MESRINRDTVTLKRDLHALIGINGSVIVGHLGFFLISLL